MTRMLVISDIHANKVALDAVLSDAKSQGYDQAVCLGDLVGYFFQPNEVVETIRDRCDYVIMGNHDAAAAGLLSLDGFSDRARQMICWTRSRLTKDNKKYLASLPISLGLEDVFLFVHGSPQDRDTYMIDFSHISEQTAYLRQVYPNIRGVFYGHTHLPAFFDQEGAIQGPLEKQYSLDNGKVYFINPGSTCQLRVYDSDMNMLALPQNGLGIASYGILDTESLTFSFFEVKYPTSQIEEDIRKRCCEAARTWIGKRLDKLLH